jgi:hypothetical protein
MNGFGVMIDAMINAVFQALGTAFAMGWEILWPLILGLTLSGIVQAVVLHSEMSRLLPDDPPTFDCHRTRPLLRMMNAPAQPGTNSSGT